MEWAFALPLLANTTDATNWLTTGGIGASAVAAIIWLVRFYSGEIKEIAKEFRTAIAAKDQQIIDLTARFEISVRGMIEKVESLIREMRTEHQGTVDQLFGVSKEVVAAVEHVTSSTNDMKRIVEQLTDRVNVMDKKRTG